MDITHNQDDKMSKQFKIKNGFRRNLFQYALIGVLSIGMVSLPGCFSSGEGDAAGASGNSGTGNSGTGGAGAGGSDVGASSDAKMVLLADNIQLPSGDSGSVRITANLKDANNVLMTGEAVTWISSSGSLLPLKDPQGNQVTDDLGNAVATLSSARNAIPRTITVTAKGGGSESSIDIDVTGTKLEISGPTNAIAINQSTELAVKLKAGDGSVLKQEDIAVSSGEGIVLEKNSITTNNQGEASIVVADSNGASGDIVFSAPGALGTRDTTFHLLVSPDSLSFKEPSRDEEIPLTESRTVKVELFKDGSALPNQDVSFSITRGTVSPVKATTDSSGIATVQIESKSSGKATITASISSVAASLESTFGVEFIAKIAETINFEAAPKRLSLAQTSTLTATIRDINQNLVKNKKVLFNLFSDSTGGFISKGEVITNSKGQASTVYTAGNQASGEDQVKVTSTVVEADGTISKDLNTDDIKKTASLTVDPNNVSISFGTGNEMFENGPTQYRVPYTIQVKGNRGVAAGVDVDISVFPTKYYKGFYETYASKVGSTEHDRWRAVTVETCDAEDQNRNGVLDASEDENLDKKITPSAEVIVGPSLTQTPTVSNSTVTTDANGFGHFSIYYPQNFANWLEVKLVAQTTQAGTQSTYTNKTRPIAIASDMIDIKISPPSPDERSPFGITAGCINTD